MLPRVASLLAIRMLRASLGLGTVTRSQGNGLRCFRCQSRCGRGVPVSRASPHNVRHSTSTVAPTVSVGTPNGNVPDDLRKLYAELKSLGNVGAAFVDTSQLQLALRSLEAKDGVVRVAGMSSPRIDYTTDFELIYLFSAWTHGLQ